MYGHISKVILIPNMKLGSVTVLNSKKHTSTLPKTNVGPFIHCILIFSNYSFHFIHTNCEVGVVEEETICSRPANIHLCK